MTMISLKPTAIRGDTLADILASVETRVIKGVLKACNGNVVEAGDRLGITRYGVYKKMERLGIAKGFGRG